MPARPSDPTIAHDRAEPPRFTEKAAFACGCFWPAEVMFGGLSGVVRTRVGFCGPAAKAPSSESPGAHFETVLVEYDPRAMRYEELLETFWIGLHRVRPGGNKKHGRAIMAHGRDQLYLARESVSWREALLGAPMGVEILVFDRFEDASSHHQKQHLRGHPALFEEVLDVCGSEEALIASAVACRLNAYLGGHVPVDDPDLEGMGLSSKGRREVERTIRTHRRRERSLSRLLDVAVDG